MSILLVNCSATSNLGGDSNRYRIRLGVANLNAMKVETPRILSRFGYILQRQEEALSDIYFESRWKKRAPFEDEIKLGIKQVDSRLIIRATPRATAGSSGHIYKVSLIAETKYQDTETNAWTASTPTDMAKAKFNEIADAFKTEFQVKGLN